MRGENLACWGAWFRRPSASLREKTTAVGLLSSPHRATALLLSHKRSSDTPGGFPKHFQMACRPTGDMGGRVTRIGFMFVAQSRRAQSADAVHDQVANSRASAMPSMRPICVVVPAP